MPLDPALAATSGLAGVASGAIPIVFRPKRKFGPFIAMVVLKENHRDDLVITEHPVDQGAIITDHAYKRPRELTLEMGWSDSPGVANALGAPFIPTKDVYARLLAFQESRTPFDIVTGKDPTYKNMLIASLGTETTRETENALIVIAVCRQIIIVGAKETTVPTNADVQTTPQDTQSTVDTGTQNPIAAPSAPDFGAAPYVGPP